jgi:hypothetical protein
VERWRGGEVERRRSGEVERRRSGEEEWRNELIENTIITSTQSISIQSRLSSRDLLELFEGK